MSTAQFGARLPQPEEPHGVSQPMPHHAVNYLMIFYYLVVLTVITVAVAYKRFSNELVNVLIALLIASTKALFVARNFMHLKFEGKLIYLILFAPVTLCLLLIAALVPDITYQRNVAFNDVIRWFMNLFPEHGQPR